MRRDLGELKLSAPVTFPDGVGSGELVATLFAYRGRVRADFVLEHDRVLATPDGVRTGQRCFLNDFQASITLPRGATELPEAFERAIVSGVLAAREGVARHNRLHPQPWHQIQIGAV